MARFNGFESAIRDRGAIKIGEFITRAGLSANCKVEIDDEFLRADEDLARQISTNMAEQIGEYEPSLIVPVPDGANYLGELVAKHLGVSYIALGKKGDNTFDFRSSADRMQATRIRRIGIVDDVYTTGSALRDMASVPELSGKIVAAGVVWDRSDSALPKKLGFDLVSLVERYVPLNIEKAQ